jgi:hypothetical protein
MPKTAEEIVREALDRMQKGDVDIESSAHDYMNVARGVIEEVGDNLPKYIELIKLVGSLADMVGPTMLQPLLVEAKGTGEKLGDLVGESVAVLVHSAAAVGENTELRAASQRLKDVFASSAAAKLSAYISAGFTRKEAMQLLVADRLNPVKPYNFSGSNKKS